MRNRILSFILPFLAACSIEASDAANDSAAERGGIGKADLFGSCESNGEALCGDRGTGNCWCDESCVDFGDCCSDAASVCGIGEEEPQLCGSRGLPPCGADEFCSFEPGAICGATDIPGVCAPRPDACPFVFAPVCGCDGETYSNACLAANAGVSVASDGACEAEEPQFCGGFAGLPCPEGQSCVDDPNDSCDPNAGGADCGGICVDAPECQPVFCQLFCENGFRTGDDGCPVCACNEDREIAEGVCIKNSLDECQSDADCVSGGCGGELCFNPAQSDGISTCECTEPQGVGCGCVNGQCAWFE